MKEYAFFLCYKCKEPYFFGANECGNYEDRFNDNNIESRLCEKCVQLYGQNPLILPQVLDH